jgi:hypothetical protein
MTEPFNNIEEYVSKDEKLIDIWGRRNPKFEKKYEDSVIKVLSEFGKKANDNTAAKGKIFGNGYEPYIIAFFIGLYANKKLPLGDDTKDLRWPLQNWGNLEARNLRKAYPQLRSYIFIALVAKTEVDWIALDKGEIKVETVVSALIKTMEEYANYGFSVMEEKLNEDKGYFFSHRSFLDIFLQLTDKSSEIIDEEGVEEL